ncbi:MAG: glycosyltransferase family 4 protein [Flavobacteriales bacterium]|jgi:glycosyltransferase involved in cell wall biosynthesis|nr:glycosyltransferase family 4 protein [Flavobacteriales bacterium]
MPTGRPTILVLYTELAPYVLASFQAAVRSLGATFHVVRWPVNNEAPFTLAADAGIHLYERRQYDRAALLQLAHDLKPDLVITSGWVDKDYLAVCRAVQRRRVPTVMSFDTAWTGSARQWVSVLASRFWMPFTFSHAWATGARQTAYARLLGFPAFRIHSGFYSADTERFLALGDTLLAQRTGTWPHRFLCVARYIPTKGQQVLCDAFAALCDAGDAGDWELHLIGTGELHAQVAASPSGRHPRIHHHGFKQVSELPAEMAKAGMFVLPSSYEPWGVVVHEQAAAGMPLLLSDAVGAAERFLEPGTNGARVPATDVAAWTAALGAMVRCSDDELRAMGTASRARAESWTPEHWALTLQRILQDR